MRFVLIDGMYVSPEEINKIQINSNYVYYAICPQDFALTNNIHVRVIEDLMENDFGMYVASKINDISEVAEEVIVLAKDAKLLKTFFDMKDIDFKQVRSIQELPKSEPKSEFIDIFGDLRGHDLLIMSLDDSSAIKSTESPTHNSMSKSDINKVDFDYDYEEDEVIGDSSRDVYSPESGYTITEKQLEELSDPSLNNYQRGYTEVRQAQIKSDIFK